jgi:hypothetical protein
VTYGYNGYAFAFNSGSWEPAVGGPAGSAPAAYGGQITVPLIGSGKAAIRDLFVNGVSAPLPLTPDGQGGFNYPANQVYVYIVYGFADYYSTIGNGREDLTLLGQVNQSNTPGKFVDYGAGYYFLRAPINLTIQQNLGSGIIATLQITGNIEAWAYPAGPRPGHSEPSPDVIPALGARGSAGPLNTTPFTLTATPLATPVDQGDRQLALPVAEQEALQASRTTVPQTALEQVFSDLLRNDLVIA